MPSRAAGNENQGTANEEYANDAQSEKQLFGGVPVVDVVQDDHWFISLLHFARAICLASHW